MKRLMACVFVLMMLSGTALAYNEMYHVKQAPNGKGDLIVFPMYFAAGDWETKMTVVNTSDTYSVVAKVVYRSHYWTEELLDHLIYLSPNDVWVGYLRDIDGVTTLYSADDSILIGDGVFASASNPVQQPLFAVDCANDSTDRGYVEVLETWYHATSSPITKTNLWAMYHHMTGPVNLATVPDNGAGYIAASGVTSDAIDHTINVMAGLLELQNRNMINYTAAVNPSVFADFDLTEYLTVGEASGLDWIASGNNTLGEVEAAMSNNDIAIPYINNPANGYGTIHMFTFPTKQAWNADCNYAPAGPFWQQHDQNDSGSINNGDQCITYSGTFYDLSENKLTSSNLYSGGTVTSATMCEELNWIILYGGSYFTEGWQRYAFVMPTGDNAPTYFEPMGAPAGDYYGNVDVNGYVGVAEAPAAGDFYYYQVPVIPMSMYLKGTGLSLFNGAYTDGEVWNWVDGITPVWLPDYQYYNEINALGMNNTAASVYP